LKREHTGFIHFSTLLFLKHFRLIFIFVVCLILFSCGIIDSIMMSNSKQKSISNTESSLNYLSKIISLDKYVTESISKDEQLRLMIRKFSEESNIDQLVKSREISELLESYYQSSLEISNISLYTSMPLSIDYQSIYSLNNYTGTNWFNCFQIDGITLFDKFSRNASSSKMDMEKLSIICPMKTDTPHDWYICTSISKDYLHSTYLQSVGTKNESIVLDNYGNIIFSQILTSLGNKISHDTISDMIYYKRADSKIITYNGKRVLASCSQTNDYGWKLITLEPLSDVINWRGILFGLALLICLILVGICYIFSNSFSKELSKPLSDLTKAMESASLVNTDDISIYEINDLYNGYNTLINDKNKLFSEIQLQQRKVVDAEIRALISQINPHFLYNTLNVISWKALDTNRPDICSLIAKLGKLYQLNYKFKSTFCSLQDEITVISLYMDLQKECFNNSFDYSIEVSEDLMELMIPKFILQPVIENAIIHGISQNLDDGHISVSATICDCLTIIIKNNGIGIEPDTLEKLNSGNYFSEKYGIKNIIERIKLACGEEYGVTFASHTSTGTTVTITLPINHQEDNENV